MNKEQYEKLEEYLSDNFFFRLNIITGAIEVKTKKLSELLWTELNEFNIYRALKVEGLKVTFNELIYLLKSDFVDTYNPIEEYFTSLKVRNYISVNSIAKLCSYIKSKNSQRFEKHFRKWLVRTVLRVTACQSYGSNFCSVHN